MGSTLPKVSLLVWAVIQCLPVGLRTLIPPYRAILQITCLMLWFRIPIELSIKLSGLWLVLLISCPCLENWDFNLSVSRFWDPSSSESGGSEHSLAIFLFLLLQVRSGGEDWLKTTRCFLNIFFTSTVRFQFPLTSVCYKRNLIRQIKTMKYKF